MKLKLLFIVLFFSTFSWGQIAAWDFTGVGTTSLPTQAATLYNSNMDASNVVSRGTTATWSTASNSFRTVGFQNDGIATTNTDYFQITLSASAGYTMSLSTIDAKFAGTATFAASPGVSNQFAYSLDGTNFTLISTAQLLVGSPATLTQINLSAIAALQNVPETTTVTLRYYASGQTTTGGWGFNSPSSGSYGLAIGGSLNLAGPCTVPLNQASSVAYSNPLVNGATISWANGASTSGSMVVIRPTATTAVDPSTSSSYTPNANYVSAGQIDTNNRVVYLAGGTSVNVTGLSAQTQYTATIYSYNALDCYNTTAPVSVNFYTLSTEPTAHAASFTCAVGSPNTSVINLTFPQANLIGALGYIILYRIGAAPTGVPVDGAYYSPGTVFGDATVVGQTSISGTDTTFSATGLNSGTTYYFSLVPFNSYFSTPGTINYRTLATIPTTNCTTTAATAVINISNNGTQVAAANVPQGTTDLILNKIQLSVTSANATLTGMTATTNGTYIASDILNLKVRYSVDNVLDATDVTLNTLTSPGVAGLKTFSGFTSQTITVGTTGYIFITADVSATAVLNNTIGLNALASANFIFASGTKTFIPAPTAGGVQTISQSAPAVPTSFTKVCSSNSTQSFTWAAPATGTFDGYLLVIRDAGVPNAVTTIVASSQTFNTNYSLAPTYNSTTSRVLYIGTGTSATITGLTPGSTYTYALYAYKNNGATSLYSATATTITQTAAVPNVTASGSTPGNTTGTITWTNPSGTCYDAVIAVVTTSAGITFSPSGNGSAYVPNTAYSSPNQVVFNNTGNFVSITGLTNGVTYYIELFVRKGTEWSTGVEVSVTPALATVFKPGELIFVGFDGQYAGSGPDDQYMLATMVDMIPGTTFSIANSRYEAGAAANVRTDKWGGPGNDPSTSPGVTNFTYNGPGNITAGSVLVLNTNSSNVFSYAGVITGTTLTDRTANFTATQPFGTGTAPNITTTNGDGEQIYLLQGSFVSDGVIDATEANYILAGTLLHGFTIKTGWVPLTSACSGVNGSGSNRQSRLPASLTCFNIESAVANTISGYYINSAQHGSTSIRNIIKAIANVTTNWVISTTRYTIDATSSASNRAGKTFIIGTSENTGQWVGDTDTNWFNCANWGRLTVPDATVDVTVDATTSQRDAVVDYTATYSDNYSDLALCKNLNILGKKVQIKSSASNKMNVYGNLTIDTSGTLDMDDSNAATADGQIYLYSSWINNLGTSAFLEGNGTISFEGSGTQVINSNVHANPETFYNVILDNNFSTALSNNLIATGTLEIKPSKTVSVASNDYIQASKKLTNNGSITIANNGQLIQVDETDTNDGDYSGTNFQINRIAQAKNLDYVYWSSPTENFAITSIPTNNRYEWSTLFANANGTQGNWILPSTATTTKGKGYIARASNGASTPTALSATFIGKPNNGQFTYPIYHGTYTGPDYDADLSNPNNVLTTAFDDNWNLVGNPYPSAIDAEEFLVANQNQIEGSVWIWKHGLDPTSTTNPFYANFVYNYSSSDYIKYNGLGSTEPDTFAGKIAAGQGFMVNMKDVAASGSTIAFTNDMRSDVSNAPYNNSDFFRTTHASINLATEEKHRIWLDIINNTSGKMDRTLLGYSTHSTYGKDNLYDCVFIPRGDLSLFSLIDDNPFIIQGRALPFDDSDLVPLGIRITDNGSHTIAIKKVDGLFAGNQAIYLEDKLLNIIHDLRETPYVFTSQAGLFKDRFVLRYTDATLSNNSNSINNAVLVAAHNTNITIRSEYQNMLTVVVYDLLGREIVKKENINNNEVILSNITAKNQVLLVKIQLENGQITTQKVLM